METTEKGTQTKHAFEKQAREPGTKKNLEWTIELKTLNDRFAHSITIIAQTKAKCGGRMVDRDMLEVHQQPTSRHCNPFQAVYLSIMRLQKWNTSLVQEH